MGRNFAFWCVLFFLFFFFTQHQIPRIIFGMGIYPNGNLSYLKSFKIFFFKVVPVSRKTGLKFLNLSLNARNTVSEQAYNCLFLLNLGPEILVFLKLFLKFF